jgi:hypothetical protein
MPAVKNVTQRQVPAKPKITSLGAIQHAQRHLSDSIVTLCLLLGRHTRKHSETLPTLSLGKPKITFVTQQDSVFFLSTIAVDKSVSNLLIAMLTRLSITIFPVTPNF